MPSNEKPKLSEVIRELVEKAGSHAEWTLIGDKAKVELMSFLDSHATELADMADENERLKTDMENLEWANRQIGAQLLEYSDVVNAKGDKIKRLEYENERLKARLEEAETLLGRASYLLDQYDDTDSRTIKRIDDYFGRKAND